MATDLIFYFNKRFSTEKDYGEVAGPVLTISRETGCNATGIARDLVREFRKRGFIWNFVNKEVLEKSSEKLRLNQMKLIHKIEAERKNYLDDIVWAFAERYHKSDKKIRETISNVIRHYANQGNMIIVGRAGAVILADMKNSLHIRLEAPLEWRIKSLSKRKMYSEKDAALFIKDADHKRKLMLEQFGENKFENIYFDLKINIASFEHRQILDMIIYAFEIKGLA